MADHGVLSDRCFVGRERELALIAEVASAARRGRSQLVVVSGPAGIGKTTLCEHATAAAARDGFAVAWGRCWPDGGAPPLWPWPSVLAELVGPEAGDVLADERRRVGVDADRFARFSAVTDVLRTCTRRQPAAIVLDDAHLADAAATLLTRFVIRTLDHAPLMILVARRSGTEGAAEIRKTLAELERDGTVVSLDAFGQDDTAALLAAHGRHLESYGLAPALTRLTGGNPLLLTRAVARASRGGDVGALDHLIERSLAGLTPEHRDVVALAAILGMEGTVADLVVMVGGERHDAVDALDQAAQAGLVDVSPDDWSFTHDLVRHAAAAVLTDDETMDAHVRALGLDPGDNRPTAAARRAHHALRSAERSAADAERAVAECRAAAVALARAFDYERAATLLESAVELVERRPPPDHVEVVLEWADALLVCGRLSDARLAYERAAELAERAGDAESRARAALGLGGVWLNEHRGAADRARVLQLQRSALSDLAPEATQLRARLGVRLAAEAVYDGEPVEPVIAALDRARRVDDDRVLAEALSLTHHALLPPEHLEWRLALADELITVAGRVGDDLRVLFGLLWRTVDLFLAGEASAVRRLSELRIRADAIGCRSISYVVAAIDVMQLIRDGRLADAEAAAHDCFEHGVDVGDADATGYYGAHLLTIRWLQDRDRELLELARDIVSSATLAEPEFAYRAAAATIAARAGLLDDAAALLAPLRAGLAKLPRSSTWLTGVANVIEAAVATGDGELAREAYPLVAPFADRPVMPSLAISCFGSAERVLGLAAGAFGDRERAVDHLRRAVDENVRLGNRPLTAIGRADLAEALIARGRPGDQADAVEALRRAADAAAAMEMGERAATWSRRAAEVEAAAAPVESAVLRREAGGWAIDAGDRRLHLADLVGFGYLRTLLLRPDEEVAALELCGGADLGAAAQELIDLPALRAYRQRVAQLDDQLEAARSDGPRRQVERLERERRALRDELSAAMGRAGRARRFADAPERARTAVRKAISRAVDVIGAADAALADDLRATIVTGRTCAYRPDPSRRRFTAG